LRLLKDGKPSCYVVHGKVKPELIKKLVDQGYFVVDYPLAAKNDFEGTSISKHILLWLCIISPLLIVAGYFILSLFSI
jgi:hypothetical protein